MYKDVKHIIFDLDQTLVKVTRNGTKWIFTEEFLPNVFHLNALFILMPRFSICTNAGGVALREMYKRRGVAYDHLPTAQEAYDRADRIRNKLLPILSVDKIHIFQSYYYPGLEDIGSFSPGLVVKEGDYTAKTSYYRKPKIGMLEASCKIQGVDPSATLFFDDMENNRLTAQAAGYIVADLNSLYLLTRGE